MAKYLPKKYFDVHIVSPRNHMLFTPLLASTAVGTLEFRSIAEPVCASLPSVTMHSVSHMHSTGPEGDFTAFLQAQCSGIDPETRTIEIAVGDQNSEQHKYSFTSPAWTRKLSYDVLVMAVGAQPLTFGIQGAGTLRLPRL